MTKYVALLRGIGPGNPNMRNDKLRGLFESLELSNVQSVISSGNIIFESDRSDSSKMEDEAETAFPKLLGYPCSTIIRSKVQLEELVAMDPFNGLTHGTGSYLMVTFFKQPVEMNMKFPYQPSGKPYRLLDTTGDALFTTTDNTVLTTTDLMTWLEREFGKQITSRTWLTVTRILKKMSA